MPVLKILGLDFKVYVEGLARSMSFDRNRMKDHKISINKHCPCTQLECPIRGNCVLCIQGHLDHKRHLPECIQNLLRPMVHSLAQQVELETEEGRPDKAFWETYDQDNLLNRAIKRHSSEE
jgi:hypothetical protein